MKQISEEAFSIDQNVAILASEDLKLIKRKALESPRQRCRLCAHQDASDLRHEMFIVKTKNTFVRPHKNLNKSSKSYHIIEGSMNLILFNEDGDITDMVTMGDYQSGKTFYYRTSECIFHTLLITSEVLVFLESTNGPFNKSDTVYANWAPKETESQKASEYITLLGRESARFINN